MQKVQYKITNCTRWPGTKKGKHKNGFIIAINRKNIHVNKHMVVNEISEAIEAFHRKNWVKIEPIENRHVTIKEATEKTEAANEAKRKKTEADLKAAQKKEEADRKAKVQKELKELEDAQKESESASSVDKDELRAQIKAGQKDTGVKVTGQGTEGDHSNALGDGESAEYVDGKEPNFVVNASKSKGKRGGRRSNKNA